MATLKEINYNIRNLIRGGILSDDERVSEAQMDFIIHSVRAMFIKQAVDKNQYISPDVYQSTCLDLTIVDKSECPEIKTNCVILRTTDKIPGIVRANKGLLVQEIGALDGSISFPLIPMSRSKWRTYNKYTAKEKIAYMKNGYLYLTNDVLQEKVSVSAVFENPIEAAATACALPTDSYPISTDMIDGLTTYIVRNIAVFPLVFKTDELNDANGAVINAPKVVGNAVQETQER